MLTVGYFFEMHVWQYHVYGSTMLYGSWID